MQRPLEQHVPIYRDRVATRQCPPVPSAPRAGKLRRAGTTTPMSARGGRRRHLGPCGGAAMAAGRAALALWAMAAALCRPQPALATGERRDGAVGLRDRGTEGRGRAGGSHSAPARPTRCPSIPASSPRRSSRWRMERILWLFLPVCFRCQVENAGWAN